MVGSPTLEPAQDFQASRYKCGSDLQLTLIEPNAKKCAFLAEVVRTIELKDVEIIQKRYEDVRSPDTPFDIVTARALGQF